MDLAELDYSFLSNQLLLNKIADIGEWVWLGAEDKTGDDKWIWSTSGRSLSLQDSRWAYDNPHEKGHQYTGNCLVGFRSAAPKYKRTNLGDWHCEKPYYFVCQMF
ncbi:unnamed protein product [Meganyctiphanes norvegica]|uniref:C-type lectin domain-containing protein n=1 Tax=Meganyctiphanes norvegica TaxID=48144 RepID=A0AAV2RKB6_MEGNR